MVNGWHAQLQVEYALRQERTTLVGRRHQGPLLVQKPFYPEGPGLCHTILLHPPGGIAGGDRLEIEAVLGKGCQALITTPGAAKWYRCGAEPARQELRLTVAEGGTLEWLPQETILYSGARAEMLTRIDLQGDAAFCGWEVTCLGRTASGERFAAGEWRQRMELARDGIPVWEEVGLLEGGDPLLDALIGLAGQPVTALFIAAGREIGDELLEACRTATLHRWEGDRCGVTRFPGVLVARYLGGSTERCRHYFTGLWRLLRPHFAGREAHPPRIWST